MIALRVFAPSVVSCLVPDSLSQDRRTTIARTVLTAARAYAARGQRISSPAGLASTIVNRRVRSSGDDLRAIEARDAADAARLDAGSSLEVGADHIARVLGATVDTPVREAVHEVIGHPVGAHAGDCAVCAAYHRARNDAAAWQELLMITSTTPRLAADLAGAMAAAGYITQTSKRQLRSDDF